MNVFPGVGFTTPAAGHGKFRRGVTVILQTICAFAAHPDVLAAAPQPQTEASPTPAAKPAQQPNIVFIFADDLGFGDIGANGGPFDTPNIDLLAARGTNFRNFTVASPVCSPSRAAIVTGQYPDRNGVRRHFSHIPDHQRNGMPDWLDVDAPSIARIMRRAGYATGHFGKWHLTNRGVPDAPLPSAYGYDRYAVFNGPGPQTDAHQVFRDAELFIRENKARPFFLNLWIHETHTPHVPDPKFLERYARLDEQTRAYAAAVASADAGIGRILGALDSLGMTKNTLVIFSSDNGPEFTRGESERYLRTDPDAVVPGRDPLGLYFSKGLTGGLRGRKRDLWEGGIRVPFIVSWPGVVKAGSTDDRSIINAIDVFPTLSQVVGVDPSSEGRVDGESLVGLLHGDAFRRRSPLFWHRDGAGSDGKPRGAVSAVRDGRWKMIRSEPEGKTELYDLDADRAEEHDVAAKHPQVVKDLSLRLDAWRASLPKQPPARTLSVYRKYPDLAPR